MFIMGWMDVLIFAKWFHHVDIQDFTPYYGPDAAPTKLKTPGLDKDGAQHWLPETRG